LIAVNVSVVGPAPIALVLDAANIGQAVWLALARRDTGAVRLGWRWFRGGGEPGTSVLELSLVSEPVVRFYDVGTPPLRRAVNVQAASPR